MVELRNLTYGASAAFVRPWMWLNMASRPGLRVIAYHGVGDVELFRIQMAYLVNNFHPVTAADVVEGGFMDRRDPVWVTFDDGDQSLVKLAMPVLNEFDISATAFICPSVVDTSEPFWWDIVQEAINTNLVSAGEILRMKHLDDDARRERTAEIGSSMAALSEEPLTRGAAHNGRSP